MTSNKPLQGSSALGDAAVHRAAESKPQTVEN